MVAKGCFAPLCEPPFFICAYEDKQSHLVNERSRIGRLRHHLAVCFERLSE